MKNAVPGANGTGSAERWGTLRSGWSSKWIIYSGRSVQDKANDTQHGVFLIIIGGDCGVTRINYLQTETKRWTTFPKFFFSNESGKSPEPKDGQKLRIESK